MSNPQVHTITSVRRSPQEEFALRKRQYVRLMGLRVVAFVAVVMIPMPLPLTLVLIAATVLLPWIAVQSANTGPLPEKRKPVRSPWQLGGQSASLTSTGTVRRRELGGSS